MKIRSMPFDEKLFSEMSPTLPTENFRPADIVFIKSLLYGKYLAFVLWSSWSLKEPVVE